MLVAAPTEEVAMPAMRSGAASPAVVRVRMPPAMVRLPPTTEALVPTDLVIRHLKQKGEILKFLALTEFQRIVFLISSEDRKKGCLLGSFNFCISLRFHKYYSVMIYRNEGASSKFGPNIGS